MWEAGAGGPAGPSGEAGPLAPRLRALSPGFALVEGETVVTGIAARQSLRLSPKRVSSRFWSQLDTAPLPRPFPDDMSHADLAHAQLADLWSEAARSGREPTEALLAVPASLTPDQLALLLGIARGCGMPVSGIVDAAVAAASRASAGPPLRGRLLHVDLELHRAVLTELAADERELAVRGAEVVPGIGLQRLGDAWLRHVAGEFVRRTRFDPLHAAASEQALDGSLARALEALAGQEEVTLEAESGGRTVAIEVRRADLAAAVAADMEALAATLSRRVGGEPVTLLLSHRAAGVPGLAERLSRAVSGEAVSLSREATVQGVLAAAGRIRHGGEALPLVTRLPVAV